MATAEAPGASEAQPDEAAPDAGPAEEAERVNPEVLRYLNRLSDLLFVLSRAVNDGGKLDVLWKPGDRQS